MPKNLKLDFSRLNSYAKSYEDALADKLNALSINPEDYLFRGISGKTKLDNALTFGTDNLRFQKSIFAMTWPEVLDGNREYPTDVATIFDHADHGEPSTILMYDSSKLKLGGKDFQVYDFLEPDKKLDALKYVVNITWEKIEE